MCPCHPGPIAVEHPGSVGWEPLPRDQESVVEVRLEGDTPGNMFADSPKSRRRYHLFRSLRSEAAPWLSMTLGRGGMAAEVLRPDAVTELVYRCLESDLKDIHWA